MAYWGEMDMILVRETTEEDLPDVQRLWADGDVMQFVGFPEGLHQTDEQMRSWYGWISASRPGGEPLLRF